MNARNHWVRRVEKKIQGPTIFRKCKIQTENVKYVENKVVTTWRITYEVFLDVCVSHFRQGSTEPVSESVVG